MKILIINGSPKNEYSTTFQTSLYIEKHFPEHEFTKLNVGRRLSMSADEFEKACALLRDTELILFSYPVYTFIAPSQLHRFISKLKESGIDLKGKYAAQISTSKHFYDITAHNYIKENCLDMGLRYVGGLSADMNDLLEEKGRKEALAFFSHLMFRIENGLYERFPEPAAAPKHLPVSTFNGNTPKREGKVTVVADLATDDTQLRSMIDRFTCILPYPVKLVNIHDFSFSNGCISCFNCASDGSCIFKDGFSDMLRNEIQTGDAIVIAFSIKDHSMGPVFKTYDDRQFCNGHRTVTMGMPFGYLVSGNYSVENNLRMIIEGRAEVGGNYLAGAATDEFDPDKEIDRLAADLTWAVENGYTQPSNFLGAGGMKIFRDLIWQMQGLMRADHKFYKKHGQYDFPQKHPFTVLKMYLAGALIANPSIRSKMGNKMNEGMIAPYKKVLEKY